ASALRPGSRGDGRCRRTDVALRREGALRTARSQSPVRHSGIEGNRQPQAIRLKGLPMPMMRHHVHVLAAVLALSLIAATSTPDVQFKDVTEAVGVAFTHANSATSNKYLIETMGGGVALLDYDNDGRLDIFFTNGAKLDDPMPAGGAPDKSDRTYWN